MKFLVGFIAACLASCYSLGAYAHGRWIIPSHTIVSGNEAVTVAFDFSISNDVFHADNAYGGIPLSLLEMDKVLAYGSKPSSPAEAMSRKRAASVRLNLLHPEGSIDDNSPIVDLGRKSVSAAELLQDGTYRVQVAHPPIQYTSFKDAAGESGRLFGPFNASRMPAGAKDIKKVTMYTDVHTYVTKNKLTAPRTTDSEGLALVYSIHPNELFTGEALIVTASLNGELVSAGTEAKLTLGGTRFRNDRNAQTLVANNQGQFFIEWQQPGMHLLELELAVDKPNGLVNKYVSTVSLEVNPE